MAVTIPRLPAFNFAGEAYDWRAHIIKDRTDLPLRWTPLTAAAEIPVGDTNVFRLLVAPPLKGRILRKVRVLAFIDGVRQEMLHDADAPSFGYVSFLDGRWGVDGGLLADYIEANQDLLMESGILALHVIPAFGSAPLAGIPFREDNYVDPQQYLGGHVLYIYHYDQNDYQNPGVDPFEITHQPAAAEPDLPGFTYYPVSFPGYDTTHLGFMENGRFVNDPLLEFGVTTGQQHAPSFATVRYIYNFPYGDLRPIYLLPDGSSPNPLMVSSPICRSVGLSLLQDFADDATAVGFDTRVADQMTVADIEAAVSDFFGV